MRAVNVCVACARVHVRVRVRVRVHVCPRVRVRVRVRAPNNKTNTFHSTTFANLLAALQYNINALPHRLSLSFACRWKYETKRKNTNENLFVSCSFACR